MSEIDRFQTSLIRLDDALTSAGFAYALIGGIAVNLRGLSRGTLDIDAVVCRADARLPELLAALEGAGFGPRGERGFSASLERRVTRLDRERIRTLVQVFAEFTDSSAMLARLEQLL